MYSVRQARPSYFSVARLRKPGEARWHRPHRREWVGFIICTIHVERLPPLPVHHPYLGLELVSKPVEPTLLVPHHAYDSGGLSTWVEQTAGHKLWFYLPPSLVHDQCY